MAQLFTPIIDGIVILQKNGVFSQADLYRRGEGVYAKQGSGFIRLRNNGETSVNNVRWLELESEPVTYDELGRMITQ